jgi:hypothetical protein
VKRFKRVKNIIKDEGGFIYVLALLIIFPVCILCTTALINTGNLITAGDIDSQEGLASACKAAAMQLDTEAQANGLVRIRSDGAHEQFRVALMENLGLEDDGGTLKSAGGMYEGSIDYVFLVYNGYDDYKMEGCESYKLYANGDSMNFDYTELPRTFSIKEGAILNSEDGDQTVTLETPGVIAVIKAECVRIGGDEDKKLNINRWASARVVDKGGTFKPKEV